MPRRSAVSLNSILGTIIFLLLIWGVALLTGQDPLVMLGASPQPSPSPSADTMIIDAPTPPATQAGFLVTRVIDGDTIELANGEKVRYIGVDSPESQGDECFQREATAKNRELVEHQLVTLETDVRDRDRYGRWLRYVYVDGRMVNNILVAEGYAVAASYPPDVKYQTLFQVAQTEAQTYQRGLWGTCPSGEAEVVQ